MSGNVRWQPVSQLRTQADIVFCIDATGSMQPCLEGVLSGLDGLVNGLSKAGHVDARYRLIAYRDYHSPDCRIPWNIYDFSSAAEFSQQLRRVKAEGGGDDPESTLDAMFLALNSPWRTQRTHKTVVVLTDDDTHRQLHPQTSTEPVDGIDQIIQKIQTTQHLMLFLVAPRFAAYEAIERSAQEAEHKVIAKWVPYKEEKNRGLRLVDWQPLMRMIGQVVSATSIDLAQRYREI
ncbi:MAG: VWA domain-containing protein [Pirellulaceae bacterium]|nr:VWA domain-containing protein [Pirellulaceae bacterium]